MNIGGKYSKAWCNYVFIFFWFSIIWVLAKLMKQQIELQDSFQPNLLLPEQTEQQKLRTYLSFFSVENKIQVDKMHKTYISLLPSQIKYDEEGQFHSKLIVKIIKYSAGYELIDVEAKLGYFTFQRISIANIIKASLTHEVQDNDSGNFCTVYRCQCKGISLAFKCFLKEKLVCKQGTLLERVIEEYCLLKVASSLGAGPKLYDILGFDIFVYPDCFEFAMQSCELSKSGYFHNNRLKAQSDLKQNLLKLHSVNIIHHDIKTENICFSNFFNKFIFIDFGMSSIIKEKIGMKSFSYFKGSLHYCSEEMAELFNLTDTGKLIDLYFNDLIGLKTTLQLFTFGHLAEEYQTYSYHQYPSHISLVKLSKNKFIKERRMQEFQLLSCLKYNILHNKIESLDEILPKITKQQIGQILSFISSMKCSRKNKQIYAALATIMQKQYKNPYEQPSYSYNKQQTLMLQTLGEINKINSHNHQAYFLNQFQINFNELFVLLKTPEEIKKLDSQCYQCLLSKVIQFNANELTLAQLQIIVSVAFQRYKQDGILKQTRGKFMEIKSNISIVAICSQFLLKKALRNQLKGSYYQIFIFILNNLIKQQTINNEEILIYYESILQIPLRFQKKVMIIIKFFLALLWPKFSRSSMRKFNQLIEQIQQRSMQFIKKDKLYNEGEIALLTNIFLKQNMEIGSSLHLSQQCKYNIRIWDLIVKIDKISLKATYWQEFIQYQSYLAFYSSNILEPYHLVMALFLWNYKLQEKLNQFLYRYQMVQRNKIDSRFYTLIDSIIKLWRSNYSVSGIKSFVQAIQHLQFYDNISFNYMIEFQFIQIIQSNKIKLNKCTQQTKQNYFKVWHMFSNNNYQEIDTKERFRELANRSFKSFLVQEQYFLYFNKKIINQNQIDTKRQTYQSLAKQIHENTNNVNQVLLECNFSLMVLLIIDKKYEQALKLGKIICQITNFISTDIITKESIIEFIIYYILQKTNIYQNRQLYLQYLKLASQKDQQEVYLRKITILIDTIGILYRYNPSEHVKFIRKMNDKLVSFNNKKSILCYIDGWQLLFIRNKDFFEESCNPLLYMEAKSSKNPYNAIILYFFMLRKKQQQVSMKDFLFIFNLCKEIDIYTKQYILRMVILMFLALYKNIIPIRRRKKLTKKVVEYNWCLLSNKNFFKLFVSPQTVKILRNNINLQKFQYLTKKMALFNRCIFQHQKKSNIKVRVQYSKLYFIPH